ncbi:MAG: urease accessory protein UreD [Flavobacteriaceae bacterium]|jgi:urease accessory protein|nr:urease accessory protein UreD [Flavobacteriaceae bacterium]
MILTLDLTSSFKKGRTYLKDFYFTTPFRIVNTGIDKTDPCLYLTIMNSSPGMLDADCYDIHILTESGSRLQLQSQSYQRLFNMKKGASQKMEITMKRNSCFSYVPHPVVPHQNSIFKAFNVIYLEDDCEFLLGEIITCGRKHSGEVFQYTHFQSKTEIFHHGKMILKDIILLQPKIVDPNTIGLAENYTHQATLLYQHTKSNPTEGLVDTLHDMLQSEDDISLGISTVNNGFVLRILGNGGEQLFSCLQRVQRHLWDKGR